MMSRYDKERIETLGFKNGRATTVTRSGKPAVVFMNDRNINKQYFQLMVEDKFVFNRGSLNKVFEKLNEL